MKDDDTSKLLRECDAGAKMAVTSIDEVQDRISGESLRELLQESKDEHERILLQIHELLQEDDVPEKEPNPMARSMSWVKTNMKMEMEKSDATVADLITDGCNMGVKSLQRYLNQYPAADKESQEICQRLIMIEEELGKKLRPLL